MDTAVAWLVISAEGHRKPFLSRAEAERWAVRCNGEVHALFFGRRRGDDPPQVKGVAE